MEPRAPLHWLPPAPLAMPRVSGHWVRVEALHPARDAPALWEAFGADGSADAPEAGADHHLRWLGWDALHGPDDLAAHLKDVAGGDGFAGGLFRDSQEAVAGMASYLGQRPAHGTVELGLVVHARAKVGTPAATEAPFLLLDHAFAAGFRRVECSCHAGNQPARRAAERLGFRHEGTLRQHRVARDQNRDTAVFSLLDREWPERRVALVEWLRPVNFDDAGRQRTRLRRRPLDAVRPKTLKLPD